MGEAFVEILAFIARVIVVSFIYACKALDWIHKRFNRLFGK